MVVEHTRIESFPQQLADDAALFRLLKPVTKRLEGRLALPGRYYLRVDEGVLAGVGRSSCREIREAIEAWAVAQSRRLVAHSGNLKEVTENPPGVPFAVTLQRSPRGGGQVLLARLLGRDLETRRSQRVETALRRKAPKLKAAKEEVQAFASLLILEADDIQLSNVFLVNDAFKQAVRSVDVDGVSLPDWVYLVETDAAPFNLWVLKGDGIPQKEGPHELRPDDWIPA